MIFQRKTAKVLGTPIDVLTWDEAIGRLLAWARNHDSRSVCICNVHSVVTARQDPEFSQIVHEADMATPDGAPGAWMLRRLGFTGQARINGPDLMWRFCQECQKQLSSPPGNNGKADIPSLYLYGGSETTLTLLQARLLEQFPGLTIAGAYSPPFRPLSDAEDAAVVEAINTSDAGVVWVSLGCPKQEKWVHRGFLWNLPCARVSPGQERCNPC